MITLSEIMSYLSDYEIILAKKLPNNREYQDVRIIYSGQKEFAPETIYITKASLLLTTTLNEHSNISLLLIKDCDTVFLPNKADILVLPEDTDVFKLLSDVQNLFASKKWLINNSMTIFKTLLEGKGINNIIKVSAEILNNPVILVDGAYRLITYTTIGTVEDQLWQDITQNGLCSNEYVIKFKKDKIFERIANKPFPIIIDKGIANNLRRIICRIAIDNEMVGILGVLESNRKFSQEDIKLIKLLADIVAIEMQKNESVEDLKGGVWKKALLDMLEDTSANKEILEERAKLINLQPFKYLYIVTIPINEFDDNASLAKYLKIRFRYIFPSSFPITYKGRLVLLLSFLNLQEFKEKEEEFVALISDFNLKAGVSSSFDNIKEIRKYYLQAEKILELGKKLDDKSRLFKYEDYYCYMLLSSINGPFNLRDYCCPQLINIIEHDEEYGTDYYETLYQYLISGQNITVAAKELNIHRNTFIYRLNKIRDIIGLDLNNIENYFKLFISYKIQDLLNCTE